MDNMDTLLEKVLIMNITLYPENRLKENMTLKLLIFG